MQPSHGKLKSANSGWQTQVGVCERYKNSPQTRFYLTPTVCKRVCRLFLYRSHTPTWVCQHEFANLSLPCEGHLTEMKNKKSSSPCTQITRQRQNYYFIMTYLNFVTDTDISTDLYCQIQGPNPYRSEIFFQVSVQKSRNYIYIHVQHLQFSEQNLLQVTTC